MASALASAPAPTLAPTPAPTPALTPSPTECDALPPGFCVVSESGSDSGGAWYQKEAVSLSECRAQCAADPACIAIELYGSPPFDVARCEVWTNNLNANAPSDRE